MPNSDQDSKTDFGYAKVNSKEKTQKVAQVFNSVAAKYDVMNDLMSFGVHRLWKKFAIELADIQADQKILDIASGTGDLAMRVIPQLGKNGLMMVTDINESMLSIAKERLLDKGLVANVHYAIANAEQLPFQENMFDRILIGFGLRNVTHKEIALKSIYACLKPGGRVVILEFSHPTLPFLKQIYDQYSFSVLPRLGQLIANDAESYRYLAESIRMHPKQETLKIMLESAGFKRCDYHNLTAGIVAVHRGFKS